MSKYYVGIDTSAYTTSLAVINEKDVAVLDLRRVLKVKKGEIGLRQQDAVFQHVNNLPILIAKMAEEIDVSKIEVVSCSSKPRKIEGSYMPVFAVGKGQAFALAKVFNCKYKEFSHQEGHIGAGMLNSGLKDKDSFISLHISGGTTELLIVKNEDKNLRVDVIGGTLDLNFGQLIDRIGVETKLPFPCGIEMDKMAECGNILNINIPMSIKKDTWFNISGLENYFKNLIKSKNYKIKDIFATLFYTIACYIYIITVNACIQYKINNVLITGGVSANKIIRQHLISKLSQEGITTSFPKVDLCTDNGVGIAYMGKLN
ncbi:MAG: hypothetical protein GX320_01515 [Tissierellia bacterium]|nr:hypothetical protein [Tissierellia bacterium]